MTPYTCEQARQWLVELTDGGRALPEAMQLHLTECATCRGAASDYQAALSAYRTVTNDDLMVPEFDAVRTATKTRISALRGWRRLRLLPLWLWGAVAAGASLLILIFTGVF